MRVSGKLLNYPYFTSILSPLCYNSFLFLINLFWMHPHFFFFFVVHPTTNAVSFYLLLYFIIIIIICIFFKENFVFNIKVNNALKKKKKMYVIVNLYKQHISIFSTEVFHSPNSPFPYHERE